MFNLSPARALVRVVAECHAQDDAGDFAPVILM
jgi:hypothetical protein